MIQAPPQQAKPKFIRHELHDRPKQTEEKQMSISLTERAAEHVKSFLANEVNADSLRLAVKPTGCSGYMYVVETAEEINDHDEVFESLGVKVVVDNESLKYLSGTKIDYAREGLNEGFKFDNPNVKDTCGCGESFNL